jgi:ribosomal protein S18 acetylase RimI-like enzyme
MLFCHYYVRFETDHCFAAVTNDPVEQVVGYVLGCPDTARYARAFGWRMVPRIVLRIGTATLWRNPRSIAEMVQWGRNLPWHDANPAGNEYPAHLHIDVMPRFQRRGLGSRLLECVETHFAELGVRGVHLVTSNRHEKSIPFYRKHGYMLVREKAHVMWRGVSDYRSLVFAKTLAL